ncbi:MAG: TadE family protein [Kineosporiaceae bacterium]
MILDRRAGAVARGRRRRPAADAEQGSAVVEFVLVGALVSMVFVAIVQLAIALHVRNTVIDAATEGARYGARAGASPEDGARRARELIAADLSGRFARRVSAVRTTQDGLEVVEVRVRAPLPVAGLWGVGDTVDVRGHAWVEQP